MIKSEFISLIQDPARLAEVDVSALKEVVEQFPYCQPAHLLLARKLQEDNSMQFEKQLNLTAAYAPSRSVLYNLLNDTNVSLQEEISEELAELTEKVVSEVDQKEEEPVAKDELDLLIRAEAASAYRLEEVPIKEENEVLKAEKEPTGRMVFSDWIRFLEGEQESPKEKSIELIERFIQKEPRIAPLKQEEVSKENKARSSSEDLPDELITETLARIHLEQGNRVKAIEIYERLKLKYPEKSPYFAAQIEFIKQK